MTLLSALNPIDPGAVIVAVCKRFGVKQAAIIGKGRDRAEVVHARQVAAWLLRRYGWSLSRIGKHMLRDHTTIRDSVQRVEDQIADHPELRTELENIYTVQAKTPSRGTHDRLNKNVPTDVTSIGRNETATPFSREVGSSAGS
jgi:hypothetical protein